MRKIFLNATAHQLTDEQASRAHSELDCSEIVDLKDESSELWRALTQCPSEPRKLYELANELVEQVEKIKNKYWADVVYLHLPIGSPAFQFLLGSLFSARPSLEDWVKPVFSHSRRETVELPDGRKISKFKFEEFIVL